MSTTTGILDDIQRLLEHKASGRYRLTPINQQQHAVQAAAVAERDARGDTLVVAVLLHDTGHMVHDLGDNPADAGIDDRHEELVHAWLTAHFGPEVTEPVRLHVAAKRYLCVVEADDFAKLSPDSVKILARQGGPISAEEAAAFEALPHHAAAVQPRRHNEQAKVKGLATPPAAHFVPAVARCLQGATSQACRRRRRAPGPRHRAALEACGARTLRAIVTPRR
jgi:predicted HD phosphohydrolase